MPSRRQINSFALVFAAVVTGSFALGAFMLVQRMRPSGPARDPSASSAGLDLPSRLTAAASHLKQGKTEQALVAYRQILSAEPRSIEAQMGLARGELSAGREEIAQQEFARALELDPNNTAALLEVARIQSHRSQTWPAAELSYREYLKRRSDDSDGWLALARVLALQKKSGEAADIFNRPDVARRMSAKDQRDYAFALVRAGRLEPAETLLKKLIAGQPKDFELRLQLAAIYSSRQDWAAALPLYESLLSEKPYDFRLNLTYGLGLLSQKRYKEALRPLQMARHEDPGDGEAGLGLARALKGSGDLRKADSEFERALTHYSSNPALQARVRPICFSNVRTTASLKPTTKRVTPSVCVMTVCSSASPAR